MGVPLPAWPQLSAFLWSLLAGEWAVAAIVLVDALSSRGLVFAYCRAMAIRRRSSGSMKWSWSSSPRSIWTQSILPVNRLVADGVVGSDRRAGFVADVGGLVGGEDHRLGLLDPAGPDRVDRRSRG